MKPLLVGVSNPYQHNEEAAMHYALYPEPRNASGDRLCRLVMELGKLEYLRRFDRTELCHPKWSAPAARRKACQLRDARTESDIIVCLGAQVAGAFDRGLAKPWKPFTIHGPFPSLRLPRFVLIPHPSGRCREWYEPGAYERARAVLVEAGVL